MRRVIILILLLFLLPCSVKAMEFTAPSAPEPAEKYMPDEQHSFGEDLWYVIKSAIADIQPSLSRAISVSASLFAVTLLVSVVQTISGKDKNVIYLVAAISVSMVLLEPSNAMVQLGVETVEELSEYGKLILPVMTAALAAQGGANSASALYTSTALFNTVLTSGITKIIVPLLYVYLSLSIVNSVLLQDILKRFQSATKSVITWCLKAGLYLFSGFITITGVVSGTADASAVKAAKLIISGTVPVVGKMISDASETILVSAGVMKSTVGVYGIVALCAILIGPFLKIGVQYFVLKITASICSVLHDGRSTQLIGVFSEIMGFLLAMTGTVCLLLLISMVCFMKGIA